MKNAFDRQIKILNNELKYSDTIIIGDNSSGKSLLLNKIVNREKDTSAIYFIDAVNRGFDAAKIIKGNEKPAYKSTILNTRLQEAYFNLMDSFNCYGTLTERIEQIYLSFEEELQELFFELTNEKIT